MASEKCPKCDGTLDVTYDKGTRVYTCGTVVTADGLHVYSSGCLEVAWNMMRCENAMLRARLREFKGDGTPMVIDDASLFTSDSGGGP